MGNELDEVTGPVNRAGRDINVIEKQIPVTIGVGSLIFEIALWVAVPAVALGGVALGRFRCRTASSWRRWASCPD